MPKASGAPMQQQQLQQLSQNAADDVSSSRPLSQHTKLTSLPHSMQIGELSSSSSSDSNDDDSDSDSDSGESTTNNQPPQHMMNNGTNSNNNAMMVNNNNHSKKGELPVDLIRLQFYESPGLRATRPEIAMFPNRSYCFTHSSIGAQHRRSHGQPNGYSAEGFVPVGLRLGLGLLTKNQFRLNALRAWGRRYVFFIF